MKKLAIIDPKTGAFVAGHFDKEIKTDRYRIAFNTKTGTEVMIGINGNDDPFVLDYPSMIDIGIMGHCENKCPFCYQGDKQEQNMTLDNFKRIIDESKDFVNQVALGGRGDPNQHEHFEEIIKYARENNVVPNYTTSGIGLSDKQVALSKMYCGAVAVSMYNQPHTFHALTKLIEAGVKTNIHMIFSSESADQCIDLIQGKYKWSYFPMDKLNAVVFLLFKPQGRGKNMTHLRPSKEQLERFANAIKDPKCTFKPGMDSCLINEIMSIRELSKTEALMADTCEGARMSCYITPDMKFMPCSFGEHDRIGIPITDSIKDIWDNGDSFKTFRDILEATPATCPYYQTGDF